MIFPEDYLKQQTLSVLKNIAQSKGIYNLPDDKEKAITTILKFQHQYGDTVTVQVTNLQPGDFFLYFIRKEGVFWADNESDIRWQGWAKATHVSSEPFNSTIAVQMVDKHPFVNPDVETLAQNPGLKIYVTFTTFMTQLPSGEWSLVCEQERMILTDTFLPATKLIRQS
jgi:hypothetical protein